MDKDKVYTSKYVGVLEGDLGVLSVKVPLRSLKELYSSANGMTIQRPASAPGGGRGVPVAARLGASTASPAQFGGHAAANAIVHGSFAPRALRPSPEGRPQSSDIKYD